MPVDYVAGKDQLPETPIAKWDANIAAMRLLKELEAEGRLATPVEQQVLAKYSGFGDTAFEQGFSPYVRDRAWKERADTLRELVSEEEYNAIKRSRLNAFYTTPAVVKAMWRGLEEMGADQIPNPKVLEPSAGSGRFLAYQPPEMAASSVRTAVELDNVTAGLLKAQFPNTTVWNTGFQDAPIPDDHFDLAISNIPFGNYGVHDPDYLASGRKFLTGSIHNYFFAKTLDKLRPGGVLAFVTTHHTMDSEKAKRIREYLAERADLVGAIRLPEDAFPDTQVVTDIVYLRKRRPGEEPGNTDWVDVVRHEVADANGQPIVFPLNKYFADNPDMVLGNHSAEGSMYRDRSYTVKSEPDGTPADEALSGAIRKVAASPLALGPAISLSSPRQRAAVPDSPPKSALSRDERARVQGMVEIGDKARQLLNAEKGGEGGEDTEPMRAELREQYQDFVVAHGELNHPANRKLMAQDPNAPMLLALEVYNRETATWEPSAIFSRRPVGSEPERNVTNAADAMSVVVNESGSLDFDRMGQLMGEHPDRVREALAEERLIFRNPMGDWEPASEYLTGRVREKLQIAGQLAASNPAYRDNVAALEAVQPEDVPASRIMTPLGAPWIPDDVVNDWVVQHLSSSPYGTNNWFRYSEDLGEWSYASKVPALRAKLHSEWGTEEMGADDILIHTLRGMPISVTRPDGKGGRERDVVGTLEAQKKAREMQESFSEWIWEDPDRQEKLTRLYNDTHNAVRPRVFDGSHLTFPGMDPAWQDKLREHQRDAIFRVVHDGTALLAHEVGFGKTAVMVASAMERKRLGLVDKPVFVVPKATHKQFETDFREMYPGAALLFPDDKDFSNQNREAFLNRITTGDWDGVILTSEQFQKIPVSPRTEAKWVQGQVDELQSALEYLSEEGGGRRGRESRTQKQIQKKLEALRVKLQDLRAEMGESTDKRVVYFEDLGIDQLYVDEADRYKNLPFATRMGTIKGLPNSESKRAWDMFLKTQYIQALETRKSGSFSRNGVVFATGTPIANTIAEAWTMMRYLQLPELRRRGLHHFDPWAKTYGTITSGLEQTPQGQYKVTQRFANFVNLPELSQVFQNMADVRVASEVPEMVAAQPRLIDDAGNPKRTVVKAESYPALQEYMETLRKRVDRLGKVDPSEDNMLLISSDARKASLDLRMVDPSAPYNPNGKVQAAAGKIAEIYQAEEADKGTQLVFLDLGTPKASNKPEGDSDVHQDGEEMTAAESGYVNDVYAILKRELVNQGVDESEIAFVQDHKTPKARKALFDKVCSGDVRVLVGSTETVGVGVNVQERAAALHHLDVPWRPRDIEQREGRVIRQGNKVYGPVKDEESGQVVAPGRGVRIFYYVQEKSFDEFMWQAVEVKGQGVKALMRRDVTARVMEDVDPLVLSAAEAKALASGNPLVLRAEELKNTINKIRLERAAERNQQDKAKGQIARLEMVIRQYRDKLPKMEVDARLAAAGTDGAGLMVGGRVIENRQKAGEAIQAVLRGLALGTSADIGSYRTFNVGAASTDRGYQLTISNPATNIPYSSSYIEEVSPAGLVARLDNLVKGIPKTVEDAKAKLDESESSLSVYQGQVGQPFGRAEELASLERELVATRAQLSGDPEPDYELAASAPGYSVQPEALRPGLEAKRFTVAPQEAFTAAPASEGQEATHPAPRPLRAVSGPSQGVPTVPPGPDMEVAAPSPIPPEDGMALFAAPMTEEQSRRAGSGLETDPETGEVLTPAARWEADANHPVADEEEIIESPTEDGSDSIASFTLPVPEEQPPAPVVLAGEPTVLGDDFAINAQIAPDQDQDQDQDQEDIIESPTEDGSDSIASFTLPVPEDHPPAPVVLAGEPTVPGDDVAINAQTAPDQDQDQDQDQDHTSSLGLRGTPWPTASKTPRPRSASKPARKPRLKPKQPGRRPAVPGTNAPYPGFWSNTRRATQST